MKELNWEDERVLECLPAMFNELQSQLMGEVHWRRIDAILQKLKRAKLIHYRKEGRHFVWHKGTSA